MQGLDGRVGEDTYNPVSGNKKAFFSVFLRVLLNGVEGVFQASCLVIDGSNYGWVFIALLG